MFGWFRKRQQEVEERVSPCGDSEHFIWEDFHNMKCPTCCSIEDVKRRKQKEDALAKKIAIEVAKYLKENP